MRKSFGPKPMCYPMPVYVIGTYNADGSVNAMVAAWGGISEEKEISICVDDAHKTVENLLKSGAFTVSMATKKMLKACDYVGMVSGNDVPDKFEKAGFTASKSELVNAPVINELPMTLECRLISYDKESCRLVGEIVNVSADEAVLDEEGKVDVNKLQPVCFDPVKHYYHVLGEKVGNAFSDDAELK